MRRFRVLLLVLVVFLLSACGYQAVREHGASTKAQTPSEVTTINWYYFPVFAPQATAYGSYEQYAIHEFQQAHPEIVVNPVPVAFDTGPDKLDYALEKGLCDVVFDAPGRIVAYGRSGKLLTLNKLLDDEVHQAPGNEKILAACGINERLYMYPLSTSPFYMAFNKKMLAASGKADLVKEGWTMEDFVQVLQALRQTGYVAGSIFCYGQGGDQATRALVCNMYGGNVIAPDLKSYQLNQPAGIKALEFVQQAVEKGLLTNGSLLTGTDDLENFVSGRSAFTILWSGAQQSAYQKRLDGRGIQVVEVPFPAPGGKPRLEYLVNGFAAARTGNSAKEAAALKFIKFMCDDQKLGRRNVLQTGGIPVRPSFKDVHADARMLRIASWTKYYAPYYNNVVGFSKMRVYWYQMLQSLLQRTKTSAAAARDFTDLANPTLQVKQDF
jgi:multiple sugar transport system substrate-binding protein